jgi:hypothetical protein
VQAPRQAIDSTSMALFNKIGDILIGWTNWLFGERLFSLRAFLTSSNLYSVGGILAILSAISIGVFIEDPAYPGEPVTWEAIEVVLVILFLICFLLFLAVLPAISKRRVALFLASLPFIYGSSRALSLLFSGQQFKFVGILSSTLLPVGIQFILIVITRKLFARISQTPKPLTILGAMSVVVIYSFSVTVLPLVIMKHVYGVSFATLKSVDYVANQASKLTQLQLFILCIILGNVTTSIMCLLPLALLVVILLHRMIWPMLKRLLYPLAAQAVVTNKKVLVPIFSLAFAYALKPQSIGLSDILKLFSS